jgi:hypothetical protein
MNIAMRLLRKKRAAARAHLVAVRHFRFRPGLMMNYSKFVQQIDKSSCNLSEI